MPHDPFNDPAGRYRVLVNDLGEHSLWPSFAAVPAGWSTELDDADRATCLAHLNRQQTTPTDPTDPSRRVEQRNV
ncbi:MbtH family protein [Kitasatospora brasiliensis]|uniref:MbtH family protein n=1 Tax=Kitasatospora brasiliensis TaxID=3058040 RepID=UPI00292E82F1|nr:MbtH family protein [Kitasatospora sp. K002]